MTRTSFTLGQSSMIMGEWAAKNGSKKVVTLVNDWAPGAESEPLSPTPSRPAAARWSRS